MAKIFMIGFVYRGIGYASNVFCQPRQNTMIYHLKMVNQFPHLFTGTLILEKAENRFRVKSPHDFNNNELLAILEDALNKQEIQEI